MRKGTLNAEAKVQDSWTVILIGFFSFLFLFLRNKKDIYRKSYFMQKKHKAVKYYKEERRKNKEEERAKEQREGVTRCELPSPRPVK